MSGPNYIDSLDKSRSRCDCPTWASFLYIFRFDTSTSRGTLKSILEITAARLYDESKYQVQPYAVMQNNQYKRHLSFKREVAQSVYYQYS